MVIGETIGQHYQVTALLGAGSMGEVFKGWDQSLNRDVAIKVLKADMGGGEQQRERFRTEAQILAKLHHSNIGSVYNFLEHEGRQVMVLQYLEGTPLDKRLEDEGALPWSEVKTIVADVLAGLSEAHQAKVVHRDLKPANLMLVPTAVGHKTVIMDFGIARAQGQKRATREGMVACTIEYASPEQVQGEEVGPTSDLYSVAMVTFELLTGRLAFQAKTDAAWAHAHVYESVDFTDIKASCGKAVAQFLQGALEKAPEKRYASALAMLEALKQLPDTPGTGESVVTKWMGALGQNRNNAKTQTQPVKVAEPKKPPAQPKPKLVQAAHADGALAASLKKNWAMVFLATMVLIGLSFVALTLLQTKPTSSAGPERAASQAPQPTESPAPAPSPALMAPAAQKAPQVAKPASPTLPPQPAKTSVQAPPPAPAPSRTPVAAAAAAAAAAVPAPVAIPEPSQPMASPTAPPPRAQATNKPRKPRVATIE